MTEDVEALRVELAAVTAERDALRAQGAVATRVWTVGELASISHAEYLANEGAVLAALREGRIRPDPDPDPDGAARAPA